MSPRFKRNLKIVTVVHVTAVGGLLVTSAVRHLLRKPEPVMIPVDIMFAVPGPPDPVPVEHLPPPPPEEIEIPRPQAGLETQAREETHQGQPEDRRQETRAGAFPETTAFPEGDRGDVGGRDATAQARGHADRGPTVSCPDPALSLRCLESAECRRGGRGPSPK